MFQLSGDQEVGLWYLMATVGDRLARLNHQVFRLVYLLSLMISISNAEEKSNVTQAHVKFAEIQSGQSILIGKLGAPIGTMVSVEGAWEKLKERGGERVAAKEPTWFFEVHKVNGEQLKTVIKWNKEQIRFYRDIDRSLLLGERMKYQAYETIHFSGIPSGIWKKVPYATDVHWGPISKLHILPVSGPYMPTIASGAK